MIKDEWNKEIRYNKRYFNLLRRLIYVLFCCAGKKKATFVSIKIKQHSLALVYFSASDVNFR